MDKRYGTNIYERETLQHYPTSFVLYQNIIPYQHNNTHYLIYLPTNYCLAYIQM
jgi:hypothetical protein